MGVGVRHGVPVRVQRSGCSSGVNTSVPLGGWVTVFSGSVTSNRPSRRRGVARPIRHNTISLISGTYVMSERNYTSTR